MTTSAPLRLSSPPSRRTQASSSSTRTGGGEPFWLSLPVFPETTSKVAQSLNFSAAATAMMPTFLPCHVTKRLACVPARGFDVLASETLESNNGKLQALAILSKLAQP